jgi:hypothetical protein
MLPPVPPLVLPSVPVLPVPPPVSMVGVISAFALEFPMAIAATLRQIVKIAVKTKLIHFDMNIISFQIQFLGVCSFLIRLFLHSRREWLKQHLSAKRGMRLAELTLCKSKLHANIQMSYYAGNKAIRPEDWPGMTNRFVAFMMQAVKCDPVAKYFQNRLP